MSNTLFKAREKKKKWRHENQNQDRIDASGLNILVKVDVGARAWGGASVFGRKMLLLQ